MPARHAIVASLCLIVTMAATPWVRAAPQMQVDNTPDAAAIREQLDTAGRLLRDGSRDAALKLLEAARARAIALALAREEADARVAIAEIFHARTQYAAAREEALLALTIYERLADDRGIGRASHLAGVAAYVSGLRAEAREGAERAVTAFTAAQDRRGRAVATLQLIRVAPLTLAEKRPLLARVVDDARAVGDRVLEGRAWQSLGDHLFTQGQYEESLEALLRAETVLSATTDGVALGTVYNSIGRVYRAHGRLDEALKFQLEALARHRAAGAPFALIQSLNAVATARQRVGDLRGARDAYDQALVLAEQSSSLRVQDLVRANLAGLLLSQGQFADGAAALERVIANGVDVYPAERYTSLSFAYRKMARPREALDAATRAVEACASRPDTCPEALQQRAGAHAALGNVPAALADVQAALARLEDIRTRLVPTDAFRQDFSRVQSSVYSEAIALQVQQGLARESLGTAELARSRALLDLLAGRDASADHTTIDHVATPDPAAVSDFVAAAARLQSTFLVYWVSDDELFIWVVTRDGAVHVRRVPILRARLRALVQQAFDPFDSGSASTRHSGPKLYDLLVRPVRDVLPRRPGSLLTIVAHGPLLGVSFAALQGPNGRYLLEDHAIHYAPAGAVLPFTARQRRHDARTGAALLVADPVLPRLPTLDRPLPRLPGARHEVATIARVMPGGRATVLAAHEATEAALRDTVAGKAVLHFATHAVVSEQDPLQSYLALAPSSAPGDGANGLLTAREVYALDLHADLVVLSACRSAGGLMPGDGISTFARAFIYAGSASVVASLWDVADQPTNRLLPAFYRHWLAGASKSRALRNAQLGLLRDLRAGRVHATTPAGVVVIPEHPVFWAGFALIGEPD
ncbi:MAG: CHAT domain-containing protein [Acidobacteria bacterium]|nr:CHAT domain-containing protein [Acidobacteriota bacterium]